MTRQALPDAPDRAPQPGAEAPRPGRVVRLPGVYRPQTDTLLLALAMRREGIGPGTDLLDLCTGSGALALHAARLGARVTAVDISRRAVASARLNTALARLPVTVRRGTCSGPCQDVRSTLSSATPVRSGPRPDGSTARGRPLLGRGPRRPGRPRPYLRRRLRRPAPRRSASAGPVGTEPTRGHGRPADRGRAGRHRDRPGDDPVRTGHPPPGRLAAGTWPAAGPPGQGRAGGDPCPEGMRRRAAW